jgi:hypothetical protein
MAGYEWFNGRAVTFGIAHNISLAEEKVDTLTNESSIDQDLCVLSIRSVLPAVGRTLIAKSFGEQESTFCPVRFMLNDSLSTRLVIPSLPSLIRTVRLAEPPNRALKSPWKGENGMP